MVALPAWMRRCARWLLCAAALLVVFNATLPALAQSPATLGAPVARPKLAPPPTAPKNPTPRTETAGELLADPVWQFGETYPPQPLPPGTIAAARAVHVDSPGRRIWAVQVAGQEEIPPPAATPDPSELIAIDELDWMVVDCDSCATCVSGRGPCCPPCTAKTRIGRFVCGLYHAVCCPDPCYEPKWKALADAAFFTAAARPVSQTKLLWDHGRKMIYPDRAEYFWAQADGSGLGPSLTNGLQGVLALNYDELVQYTEIAHGAFSVFVETPYRSVSPNGANHGAGFADISLGTKTLLFDCELLQVAFQFKTITPSGSSTKGLGTAHVSLEPSLIAGVNLGPRSYLQAQVAEWIPIGGVSGFAGALLHYHTSYNHTLYHLRHDIPIIGTLEVNGWSFQDGSYSDPYLGQLPANDETYLSFAPGFRTVVCDKIDFGISAAFAGTRNHWAKQLYRFETRMRY